MKRRFLMKTMTATALSLGLAATLLPAPAAAQEVTLRLHQFLPPAAPVPAHILKPWAARIEERAGGALKIEHYDAMSLGGRPPDLMDQAIGGVADIVMTVVGYTPGRFPKSEVFELPFMMTDPVATARAFQEMVETTLQDEEYSDVKVLGAWVHGPGLIHSKEPITRLEDLQGKKLRGPTRVITDMLNELGATPVGMPLPAIPEAISKGVIDATVIPWEVTASIRLAELVDHHVEFAGTESLYTATIITVMNRQKYESLPDNIRAAIDAESGQALAAFAAQVMYDYDAPARDLAVAANNTIVTLDEDEVARWKEKAQPVVARWIADMESRGIDGAALIEEARALIQKHGG